MQRRYTTGGEAEDPGEPVGTAAKKRAEISASGEAQIRDDELYRMAAFRIRETANRIGALANSARDSALHDELVAVYQRLLDEERALLTRASRG